MELILSLLLYKTAQYVSFTPEGLPLSVQGYFALIHDSWEISSAGLKQAKAYYQYVFFQNQWIESFHQECAKHIAQLALDFGVGKDRVAGSLFSCYAANEVLPAATGIPIFVLKVDCPSQQYDLLWHESGKCVELKSPQHLEQLFHELMQVQLITHSHIPATSFVCCVSRQIFE